MYLSDTGTWTMLLTNTDGRSCVIASGDSWFDDTPLIGDPA